MFVFDCVSGKTDVFSDLTNYYVEDSINKLDVEENDEYTVPTETGTPTFIQRLVYFVESLIETQITDGH